MSQEDMHHIDLMKENYGNVKDIDYSYVVLPWGATEPHNYHLPYLTDCILSHDIAVDAVEKAWSKFGIRGMVLPPIPLGAQNPGQVELPFCIHTKLETQKAVLTDIVESLIAQGFNKLIVLNGHGGNSFKPMLRDMSIRYPQMFIVLCEWYSIIPRKGYFDEDFDDHAGEQETSVMMHYRPELVNLAQAGKGISRQFNIESLNNKVGWTPRNWKHSTQDTGVGFPGKSTAEKGARYIGDVTDKIALLFDEIVNKQLY